MALNWINQHLPLHSDSATRAIISRHQLTGVYNIDLNPNYPLLLHYHPLTIYRHQVAKQADTLLADYLLDDILKHEYAYYEGITTHDSSLSRSIFSILAARMGDSKAVPTTTSAMPPK